ncbi:putative zinc-binding protein [Thalassotalea sp. G2M2-11]|uniref:putative zinc-binding protein n=1 Tax=Thalassotalea sp. G2M2-11 TaxID=2787627 RepID=UPI0019D2CA97|nr:putative zinc-binding protein [Thalassotalea sp. G2M2-11]
MSEKPIVYSCSGCSNVARIAHDISLNLDSDGIADMSCVSGVIGNVEPIKAIATSARTIIAIDGCQLCCTKTCLDASDVKTSHHFVITDLGIEKRDKWQDSLTENSKALIHVYGELAKQGIGFSS